MANPVDISFSHKLVFPTIRPIVFTRQTSIYEKLMEENRQRKIKEEEEEEERKRLEREKYASSRKSTGNSVYQVSFRENIDEIKPVNKRREVRSNSLVHVELTKLWKRYSRYLRSRTFEEEEPKLQRLSDEQESALELALCVAVAFHHMYCCWIPAVMLALKNPADKKSRLAYRRSRFVSYIGLIAAVSTSIVFILSMVAFKQHIDSGKSNTLGNITKTNHTMVNN